MYSTGLTFFSLPRLRRLELQHNRITLIESYGVQGAPLLRFLNVSSNRLTRLDDFVERMTALHRLDASENQIRRVDTSRFVPLTELVELHMAGNRLCSVEHGALAAHSLRLVDFTSNRLETLPRDAFAAKQNMSLVFVDNNPLNCDCRARWMAALPDARCATPRELRGRHISGIVQRLPPSPCKSIDAECVDPPIPPKPRVKPSLETDRRVIDLLDDGDSEASFSQGWLTNEERSQLGSGDDRSGSAHMSLSSATLLIMLLLVDAAFV